MKLGKTHESKRKSKVLEHVYVETGHAYSFNVRTWEVEAREQPEL